MFCDKVTRSWKQIIYHHQQQGGRPPDETQEPQGVSAQPQEDEVPLSVAGLVRDERGVRLARPEEAD